ncbi:MAG: DUF4956 domain-containing protein [Planctomycetota bacterium]
MTIPFTTVSAGSQSQAANQAIDLFGLQGLSQGSAQEMLIGLTLAIILGQILSWHYGRFAQVLSNKTRFARIFVLLTVTTFLIITVVKTSLALSLGLVGALSIIRFRTPLKEPEELAYLFLTIAVGVGLGANQAPATVIIFALLLVYMAMRHGIVKKGPTLRSVLQVIVPLGEEGRDMGAAALKLLLPAVESCCSQVDLRRVDSHEGELHCSLVVELAGADSAAQLLETIAEGLPGSQVSIIERDGLD